MWWGLGRLHACPESGNGGMSLCDAYVKGQGSPETPTAVFTEHGFPGVTEKEVTPFHWEPVWTVFPGLTGASRVECCTRAGRGQRGWQGLAFKAKPSIFQGG